MILFFYLLLIHITYLRNMKGFKIIINHISFDEAFTLKHAKHPGNKTYWNTIYFSNKTGVIDKIIHYFTKKLCSFQYPLF